MEFRVEDRVFESLPTLCFSIVVAFGLDNSQKNSNVGRLLEENSLLCQQSLADANVKEYPAVACYRGAFRKLNINPNKFMCSIEALLSRISKGKGMSRINAAVDLGNAVSLKYKLPIGAHDIDTMNGEISVRYSQAGDYFIPFGCPENEIVDENEIVYSSGNSVRTRKWIWRQSEEGKITEQTKNIFYPIDGFTDINKDTLLAAQRELSDLLEQVFGCTVRLGWVDAENRTCSFKA